MDGNQPNSISHPGDDLSDKFDSLHEALMAVSSRAHAEAAGDCWSRHTVRTVLHITVYTGTNLCLRTCSECYWNRAGGKGLQHWPCRSWVITNLEDMGADRRRTIHHFSKE